MCAHICALWPLLKLNQSALLSIRVTISKVAASNDITAAGSPAGAQKGLWQGCEWVWTYVCVTESKAGISIVYLEYAYFMGFVNAVAEQNVSRPCQRWTISFKCLWDFMCVYGDWEHKWDFQPQLSPSGSLHILCLVSIGADIATVKKKKQQQEFHLSLIKPINDGVWCLLHSFHAHRHAAALTNRLFSYQDYHTVKGTSWTTINSYRFTVYVCACVGCEWFSHTKSCKPENTDHKLPTSMSNQQPYREPTNTQKRPVDAQAIWHGSTESIHAVKDWQIIKSKHLFRNTAHATVTTNIVLLRIPTRLWIQ